MAPDTNANNHRRLQEMGDTRSSTMRLGAKASRRLFGAYKRVAQLFAGRIEPPDKTVLLILGCQRSGTTLVQEILQRDMRSKIYREFSKLSSDDREFHIRLNPLDSVRKTIEADRAGLIVLKPLVESQNALKLLDALDNAKILWMYRDYRDTAVSSISMFGRDAGLNNLKGIIDNREGNWRTEGLSDELRAAVSANFSPDMDPHDAAALFWFVRNSWLFELNLETNARVTICRYEDLVAEPAAAVKRIYDFLGHKFPGERILPPIHQKSTGQGGHLELSEDIERLCSDLLGRLDQAGAKSTAKPEN
jgi:hypothetical protein